MILIFWASDFDKFKLLIKESLLIKRDKPGLNGTLKSFPLDLFDLVLMFTFYTTNFLYLTRKGKIFTHISQAGCKRLSFNF